MAGRVMSRQEVVLAAGFNSITINVNNLPAGTYNILGSSVDGRSKLLRFVKE
jgi:hypothetical protein